MRKLTFFTLVCSLVFTVHVAHASTVDDLREAIMRNDLPKLKAHLQNFTGDINKNDEWGVPPLFHACNKANEEIVKELRRFTSRQVKIIKGFTSRKKSIVVQNMTEKEFEELIKWWKD